MAATGNGAWKASLRKHHSALRSGVLVGNVLPSLRTLLTDVEYLNVEGKEGDVARVNELVRTLLTKDYPTFDGFCSALEENGYAHWARKLRGTEGPPPSRAPQGPPSYPRASWEQPQPSVSQVHSQPPGPQWPPPPAAHQEPPPPAAHQGPTSSGVYQGPPPPAAHQGPPPPTAHQGPPPPAAHQGPPPPTAHQGPTSSGVYQGPPPPAAHQGPPPAAAHQGPPPPAAHQGPPPPAAHQGPPPPAAHQGPPPPAAHQGPSSSGVYQGPPPPAAHQGPPPPAAHQGPPPPAAYQGPPPPAAHQGPPPPAAHHGPPPSGVYQGPPPPAAHQGPQWQDMQGDSEHDGEDVDGPVHVAAADLEEDVLAVTLRHITGVLQDHYCRRLGNEVSMAKSSGQRSVPFHEKVKIASAVCRTVWKSQIEGDSKIYGSGSFVSCVGKFYLLTCCHNFLSVEDGDNLLTLEDDDLERKMKSRCKRAQYLCSTSNFEGTVALKADIVFANRDELFLIFDKAHDLLLVEVKNPADFPHHLKPEEAAALLPILPIPLQPLLRREGLLKSALLLTIVHFPREDNHRAECLEFAMGLRVIQRVCQETQVVYMFDTYHGSSGSPVLYVNEGEVVVLAVHRKSTAEAKIRDENGELTRIAYNIGSVLTQDFLRRLIPNDGRGSGSIV